MFGLIGIKHWENPELRKYEGRIVLGGDDIKAADGFQATFQNVGSVPATMQAARVLSAS